MKREGYDVIAMMLFIAEKTVTFRIIDETHIYSTCIAGI